MEEIIKTRTTIERYKVYKTSDGQEWEKPAEAYLHEDIITGRKVKCPTCGGSGTIWSKKTSDTKWPGDIPGERETYQYSSGNNCPNCVGEKWVIVDSISNEQEIVTPDEPDEISKLKAELEEKNAAIKEFEETFQLLQVQVREMQLFNGKLAYANKVFNNSNLKLSYEEKLKIAGFFDDVETIEAAKELYHNIVSNSVDKEYEDGDIII